LPDDTGDTDVDEAQSKVKSAFLSMSIARADGLEGTTLTSVAGKN